MTLNDNDQTIYFIGINGLTFGIYWEFENQGDIHTEGCLCVMVNNCELYERE